MAKQQNPDALAAKTFMITILGALIYIAVVFTFVIGGNRREEANNVNGAETPTLQAGQQHD